jgi:MYXO-CTERM domain-containing protein
VGVGSSAVIRSALVESMEVTTEETELWLVGRDAQDQVVLGVEGAWSLADQDQGFGDRYVWAHDPMSRPKALQVIPTAGPTPDAVEIRGEGQAKGAGDTGCTSAGGVPAILLGLAGLAALRRRQLSS